MSILSATRTATTLNTPNIPFDTSFNGSKTFFLDGEVVLVNFTKQPPENQRIPHKTWFLF